MKSRCAKSGRTALDSAAIAPGILHDLLSIPEPQPDAERREAIERSRETSIPESPVRIDLREPVSYTDHPRLAVSVALLVGLDCPEHRRAVHTRSAPSGCGSTPAPAAVERSFNETPAVSAAARSAERTAVRSSAGEAEVAGSPPDRRRCGSEPHGVRDMAVRALLRARCVQRTDGPVGRPSLTCPERLRSC